MPAQLNPKNYYRLPWTVSDNAITWLEITSECNISCSGCYRKNRPHSHKSIEEVKHEITAIKKIRKCSCIFIAGGEPLIHPALVDIVKIIKNEGFHPYLITNGIGLEEGLLIKLKKAGLIGVTFHIDSGQNRPEWEGTDELKLNELRLHYAKMLAKINGVNCGFNATIDERNINYVPTLVQWAQKHIDIVNSMTFIAFRTMPENGFDYYVNGQKINIPFLSMAYLEKKFIPITTNDIYNVIKKENPDFDGCTYLGGTVNPDSIKWLFCIRAGMSGQSFGYIGANLMKIVQKLHRLFYGKYMGSVPSKFTYLNKLLVLFLPFDNGIKKIFLNYILDIIKKPRRMITPLRFQNILVIQPMDILEGGAQNMCDGCPDMTIWNNQLVWSCRLEEVIKYGCFIQLAPEKNEACQNIYEKSLADETPLPL